MRLQSLNPLRMLRALRSADDIPASTEAGYLSAQSRVRWSGPQVARDLQRSSIVAACLNALVSGVTSCRPIVVNSADEEVPHPITEMVTDEWLASMVRNGAVYGNSVSLLGEDGNLSVTGLEPLSSARLTIERRRDGSITYRYTRTGFWGMSAGGSVYAANQVFHYRYQIDPDRAWVGISPLATVAPELTLDRSAADYGAGFMRRFGIPGILVMPKPGKRIPETDRQAIRQDVEDNYMGANSGGVAVSPSEVDLLFAQGPRQMLDLGTIRDIPDFRVCGSLQVPPIVAMLSAGYRFSTANATVREIEARFAERTIQPLQDALAQALTAQVLARMPNSTGLRVDWDRNDSYLFRRDLDAMSQRQANAASILTVNERREMMGYDPLPGFDYIEGAEMEVNDAGT